MTSKKKQTRKKNNRRQAGNKKAYDPPKLIIHGDVETITGGKGLVLTDGGLAGSLLL